MMNDKHEKVSGLAAFLANAGVNYRLVELESELCFFYQGDPADSVYCLLNGRVKLLVVSERGKQATITLLSPEDFFGEESLAAAPQPR